LQLITQSQPAIEWQCTLQNLDLMWQVPTKSVMEVFTKRTIHSYMEVFEHSIVWQYGDADPEFGFAQSKELEEYLIGLLDRNKVNIVRGYHQDRKYIQVRTKGICKAQFMENVVLSLRSINVTTDFVLVAGDDDSDEPLFAKANQLDMPFICHEKPAIFTTVIGKRKTVAKKSVDGVSELMQIMKRLSRNAIKDTKFYSTSDLYRLGTTKKAVQKSDPDTSSYTRYRKLRQFGSTQQLIHASHSDSPFVGSSVSECFYLIE
jgi:trehalose 6-phosphate synthase/phosphatase